MYPQSQGQWLRFGDGDTTPAVDLGHAKTLHQGHTAY